VVPLEILKIPRASKHVFFSLLLSRSQCSRCISFAAFPATPSIPNLEAIQAMGIGVWRGLKIEKHRGACVVLLDFLKDKELFLCAALPFVPKFSRSSLNVLCRLSWCAVDLKISTQAINGDWSFLALKSTIRARHVLRCMFFQNHENMSACSLPTLPLHYKSQPTIEFFMDIWSDSKTAQNSKI
jgi:hypothetical protein